MHGVRRAEVQLGETACVIGLGLVGQLAVRLLVAAGVRVVGLDMIEDRCRLAEKAGAVLCAAPPTNGTSGRQHALAEITERARRGPRAAGRRRVVERPRRGGGQAGPGPGPGGRHRQDPAGPAVERLLRQGTRRPVLPVLRARPLRRPVRARRHRLPGRLRALDRAAQPGVLPRPARPQRNRGRSLVSGVFPMERAAKVYSDLASGYAQRRRRAARVPGRPREDAPAPATSLVRPGGGIPPGPLSAVRPGSSSRSGSSARATTRRRCCCRIWPGSETASLAHVATTRSLSAVNAQRKFGFSHGLNERGRGARRRIARRDLHRDPARTRTPAGLPGAGDGQGGLRREAARADPRGARADLETIEKTGNDRLMVGFNRRFAPLLHDDEEAASAPPLPRPVTRYLVNAGPLGSRQLVPATKRSKGSRFAGEGGHFIDTLSWWAGSLPTEVYAVRGPERSDDVGHRALPRAASTRHDQLRHRRQRALPQGDAGRHRRRPQRPARQLQDTRRSGPGGGKDAVKARGGQDKGQRAADRAFRRRRQDRRPDADRARIAARHHGGDHRRGREPAERTPGADMTRSGLVAPRLVRPPGCPDVARRNGLARARPGACRRRGRAARSAAAAAGRRLPLPPGERRFGRRAARDTAASVPDVARKAVIAAADQLDGGRVGGTRRRSGPTWWRPTGSPTRSPAAGRPADGTRSGSTTVDEAADRQHQADLGDLPAAAPHPAGRRLVRDATTTRTRTGWPSQLRSWWRENPFLSGVHWTSGIEVGIRLISLAWIRRLLDDWPEVADLFEHNRSRSRRFAGTSSTWPRSAAAARRRTTT